MKLTVNLKTVSLGLAIITVSWLLIEDNFSEKRLVSKEDTLPTQNNPNQGQEPQNNFSQSDGGAGGVTFTAQYLPDRSSEDKITFEVSLNTHSVDLSEVNFGQDIFIEKDRSVYRPTEVETSGSSHHRSAVMSFPKTQTPFKVVGQRISGVEKRELTWERLP